MADSRAYEALTLEHLSKLAGLARADRDSLIQRCPHLTIYRERVVAVALCQGGALHYVNGHSGVKDLDLWTLYAAHEGVAYPHRRVGRVTGCEMLGLTRWTKRVDLLGRSLPITVGIDPAQAWHSYLGRPLTTTARMLMLKPVVLVEPPNRCGEVVWNL